jgi:serine/threonine protein kinase
MVHGDIKPENIMVTSYNQLFLTDIKPYKPAYLPVDDLTNRRRYFGELDHQTRSYLAPERFVDSVPNLDSNSKITTSMDIFSAGCVISEILLDGMNFFDPAKLQAFRKGGGEFDPKSFLERHLEQQDLIELALKMTSLDPEQRPDISTCLQMFMERCPVSYHRCFFQLGSCFVRPEYLYSDMKVSLIRKYFASIWRTCFGNRPVPVLYEPVERILFESLRQDNIDLYSESMAPGNELFSFMDLKAAEEE